MPLAMHVKPWRSVCRESGSSVNRLSATFKDHNFESESNRSVGNFCSLFLLKLSISSALVFLKIPAGNVFILLSERSNFFNWAKHGNY